MNNVRITKIFRFEMAHALKNHDGPCKNIHGHSYELQVTVIGLVVEQTGNPKNGMVIDFQILKDLVNAHIVSRLDHALLLENTSSYLPCLFLLEPAGKIEGVDYTPTSENMLIDMARVLKKNLPPSVRLHHLKLSETATSFAEWYADDNKQ